MYLWKNACRNIRRMLPKNILIGMIILIISCACTLALSIQQAALTTKEEGLKELSIRANISYDRKKAITDMDPSKNNDDSEGENGEIIKQPIPFESLTLEELETYAKADSVNDFYYTASLTLNGNGTFNPIENSNSMGRGGIQMNQSDFTIIGYSSKEAMQDFDFNSGSNSIIEGNLFSFDSTNECMISEELALYNEIEVGDTITLVATEEDSKIYTLTVCGIYNQAISTDRFMQRNDPANQIYTNTLTIDALKENVSQEPTVNGTYLFASVEDYEVFEEQARKLGLSNEYVIQSNDLNAYEQSLIPLNRLSEYAKIFLIVILIIGAVILIIFHFLRMRERKYEIGVLAAIGMNKRKIACQFMMEILIVTVIASSLGIAIGSVSSVPLTNTLLASSTSSSSETIAIVQGQGTMKDRMNEANGDRPVMEKANNPIAFGMDYVNEVNSATNRTVIAQLFAITIALTLLSSSIAILFLLRYEPLRILSERE